MSDHEIDARRAVLIAKSDFHCSMISEKSIRLCIRDKLAQCACLDTARAIRLSDAAAGYITARLEGVVNEKDRK